MRDVRRIGGRRGLRGGACKRVDGVFPERPQSFRHQRRPMDDCSLGREGMAQDGGTRSGTMGGTFHGEIDHCRKGQDWTTAYSICPNVTGRTKDVLVRSPLLTRHKWYEFVSYGRLVCRCDVVFLWCYVLFCFVFVFLLSLKLWPFA